MTDHHHHDHDHSHHDHDHEHASELFIKDGVLPVVHSVNKAIVLEQPVRGAVLTEKYLRLITDIAAWAEASGYFIGHIKLHVKETVGTAGLWVSQAGKSATTKATEDWDEAVVGGYDLGFTSILMKTDETEGDDSLSPIHFL